MGAGVGGQRHANAAPDEMKEIADERRVILGKAGRPTPASDLLYAQVDARYQAWAASTSIGTSRGPEEETPN